MDAERIAEIRERCDKASEGPWVECSLVVHGLRPGDAKFIAHSRQDVPDLLAEVERLRAENEVLEEALDSLGNFVRENLDYCAADFVGEGIDYAPCKFEYNPEEGNNRCFVNCWAEAFKNQAEGVVRAMAHNEQKMKLCSECGSPAEMHIKPWDDETPFFVECTNIWCTNRGPEAESVQKAIEGWNKWVEAE